MKYTAHFNGGQDTLEVASAAQRGPDTEGGVPAGANTSKLKLNFY